VAAAELRGFAGSGENHDEIERGRKRRIFDESAGEPLTNNNFMALVAVPGLDLNRG